MSFQQPPDESAETSFWAAVYTEEPPNVLCGVLTDLNLHRFTLHQQLIIGTVITTCLTMEFGVFGPTQSGFNRLFTLNISLHPMTSPSPGW